MASWVCCVYSETLSEFHISIKMQLSLLLKAMWNISFAFLRISLSFLIFVAFNLCSITKWRSKPSSPFLAAKSSLSFEFRVCDKRMHQDEKEWQNWVLAECIIITLFALLYYYCVSRVSAPSFCTFGIWITCTLMQFFNNLHPDQKVMGLRECLLCLLLDDDELLTTYMSSLCSLVSLHLCF